MISYSMFNVYTNDIEISCGNYQSNAATIQGAAFNQLAWYTQMIYL